MAETVFYGSKNLVGIGNVGIGTTNPGAALDVRGSYQQTGGNMAVTYSQPSSASSMFLFNDSVNGCGIFLNGASRSADGGAQTGTLRNDYGDLRVQAAGGFNNALGITIKGTSGNVGIGVASPLAPLHTYSASSGLPDTTGSGTSNVTTRFQVATVALDMGNIVGGNTWLQNHSASSWATNYPLLLNPNGGGVGIGTTNPKFPLVTSYVGNNDLGTTTKLNFGFQVHNTTASGSSNRPNLILFTDNNSTQGAIGGFRSSYTTNYLGGLVFYVGSQPSGYTQNQPATTAEASGSLTEAMRINVNGNVGIGSDSPAYKLDVNGTIRGTTLSLNDRVNVLNADPGDMIVKRYGASGDRYGMGQYNNGVTRLFSSGLYSGSSIRLSKATDDVQTGGAAFTDLLICTNNGDVGIGTDSPNYRLDVNGGVLATTYNLNDATSTNGSRPSKRFNLWTDGLFSHELQNQNGTWNVTGVTRAADGGFSWKKSDGTNLMYINNAGNVGIGTGNPGAKLVISGANPTTRIETTSTVYNGGNCTLLFGSGTAANDLAKIVATDVASSPNAYQGKLQFYTQYNTAPRLGMTLLGVAGPAVNVGIGTDTPAESLEIYTDDPVLRIRSATGSTGSASSGTILLQQTNGTGMRIKYNGNSDIFAIETMSGGTVSTGVISMKNSGLVGAVGIGTGDAAAALHVYRTGNAEIRVCTDDAQKARIGMYEESVGSTWGAYMQYNGATDNLEFGHKTSGTDTAPRMVIDTAGEVGIGTESPSAGIHVNTAGYIFGLPYTTGTATSASGTAIYTSGGYDAAGTTHTITLAKWSRGGDTVSGYMMIYAKNTSTVNSKIGVQFINIIKRYPIAPVISNPFSGFSQNMTTWPGATLSGNSILVSTDSDCRIAWQFFMAA